MSANQPFCNFITDSVGYTKSFSTKRSPILPVWLTAILWLLVLWLDCPWALSHQGRTIVSFKGSGHVSCRVEAIVLLIPQTFFLRTRSFENLGISLRVSPFFNWGIFSHVPCL